MTWRRNGGRIRGLPAWRWVPAPMWDTFLHLYTSVRQEADDIRAGGKWISPSRWEPEYFRADRSPFG